MPTQPTQPRQPRQPRQPTLSELVERNVRAALAPPRGGAAFPPVLVQVKGTRAVLRGGVGSWAEHEAAELAASNTPGVSRVDNHLCLVVRGRVATAGRRAPPQAIRASAR